MSKIEVLKLVNQNGEEMGAYVTYSDFCKMQSEYESMIDSMKNCVNCANHSWIDDISGITVYTCDLRNNDVIGQPECPCDKWRGVK